MPRRDQPKRDQPKRDRSNHPRRKPDDRRAGAPRPPGAARSSGATKRPTGAPRPTSTARVPSAPRPASSQRPDGAPRPGNNQRKGGPRRIDSKEDKGALWKPGPSAQIVGAESGDDLAHFIASRQSGLSIRAVRRALDAGACRVNGAVERFGSYIVRRGDVVEFFIPKKRPEDHDYEPERLVHDDDGIVVYDKPPGLSVTPPESRRWNLLDCLKKQFGELHAVHRLDADTSGLVIFSRTKLGADQLEEYFRAHRVKKTYLAIVRGHPRDSGIYRSYLVKVSEQQGHERWRSGRGPDAREAVTEWKVEERIGAYASLVEVSPQTGRYHQIRIHFSEMGHPVYGDRLYGDRRDPIHVTRHLLHAWKVKLPNPMGGRELELKTKFPEDFTEAKRLLAKV